jgi:putative tricarboxylic transport membrane protein
MIKKPYTRREALRLAAIGGAGAAVTFSMPSIVRAQDYPERPINVVIPFATGGYNDRLARAFDPFLREEIGQPLVMVNRPGGGALLGHTYFLQQPHDGYTIMCTSAVPYIHTNILLNDADFTVEDFRMLNLPSRDYTLGATAAGSQIESWEQVIDSLKSDPTSVSLGVQPGSADFLNLMLVIDAEDIDREALRIVTYDGGGPARTAAAGGHVDVSFVGAEGFLPLADQIRPLIVFSDDPFPGFDDTETIAQYAADKGIEAQSVPGSMRGWVVSRQLMEEHPDRYEAILGAVEQASTREDSIAALEGQQLATEWFGPEASQEAYLRSFATLERHVDLIREA